MPQKAQVTLFLAEFKELASCCFAFVERGKCLDTIARLGITIEQAKEEILELTYEDYYKGPETDTERSGYFWTFGKIINGEEIFIRLKIVPCLKLAKCQSFHIADRPIDYPYKGRRREQ